MTIELLASRLLPANDVRGTHDRFGGRPGSKPNGHRGDVPPIERVSVCWCFGVRAAVQAPGSCVRPQRCPRVRVYGWDYVLVEAGPHEAGTWRSDQVAGSRRCRADVPSSSAAADTQRAPRCGTCQGRPTWSVSCDGVRGRKPAAGAFRSAAGSRSPERTRGPSTPSAVSPRPPPSASRRGQRPRLGAGGTLLRSRERGRAG